MIYPYKYVHNLIHKAIEEMQMPQDDLVTRLEQNARWFKLGGSTEGIKPITIWDTDSISELLQEAANEIKGLRLALKAMEDNVAQRDDRIKSLHLALEVIEKNFQNGTMVRK